MKETPFIIALFIITFFVIILVLSLKAEKVKQEHFRQLELQTAINMTRETAVSASISAQQALRDQERTNAKINEITESIRTDRTWFDNRITTLENKPTYYTEYNANAYCVANNIEGDEGYILTCKDYPKIG